MELCEIWPLICEAPNLNETLAYLFARMLDTGNENKEVIDFILSKVGHKFSFSLCLAEECGKQCIEHSIGAKYFNSSVSNVDSFYNKGLYRNNNVELALKYGIGDICPFTICRVAATNIMDYIGYDENNVDKYLLICFHTYNRISLRHLIRKVYIDACNKYFNETGKDLICEAYLTFGLQEGLTLSKKFIIYLRLYRKDLYDLIQEQV